MAQQQEEWEVMKVFEQFRGKSLDDVKKYMSQFDSETDFLKTIKLTDNPVKKDRDLLNAAVAHAKKLSIPLTDGGTKRQDMSKTLGAYPSKDMNPTLGEKQSGKATPPVDGKRLKELKEKDGEIQKLHDEGKVTPPVDGKRLKELKEKDREIQQLHDEYRNLTLLMEERNGFWSQQEEKMEKLSEKNSDLEKHIKSLEEEKKHLEDRLGKEHAQSVHLDGFCRDLEKELKRQYKEKEQINKDHQRQLNEIREERDELKSRFSKLAGDKLHDNNADIADLSDPNRAMKLSEKFGQLYDDQWTDAFEEMMKNKNIKGTQKEATVFLIEMLQKAFDFCETTANNHFERLKEVVLSPFGKSDTKARVKSREERMLKDARRQIAAYDSVIDEIKKGFISTLTDPKIKEHVRITKPFLELSVEICWMMVLHEPPLYMDMSVRIGEPFDTNKYTSNTASGKTVEFLVWPPLFNGKGGGLLSKGVVSTQKIIGRK
ncbi:probable DNA double-strand break repair Rad50 ATPase isoform X2 [Mya arenaria]|uniref:probable DNA double-strand break repair Rad50 ATPase isoform X2 n=1 Tax=Mya arenaria TaxID=6604 RepID=UPI0022E146C2|nr:probable DNA double-strand break repair Rad50 ATPase isoform X2 [Mya arenaria]